MKQIWYWKYLTFVRDKCCGRRVAPENRTIFIGNPTETRTLEKYPDNKIVSSRYTIITFLPKNIFEQFHRIANFYFLCMAVISLIIDGPVSPWTSIVPLVFVVTVTAVKQGYEDYLRHRADREVNHRKALIIEDGKAKEVRSQDIHVGDIVKVRINEDIPCDLVLLSSEDIEGECSITTANLDGETNLKTFCSISDTRIYQSDESFLNLHAIIECQQPIIDLYKFIGRISTDTHSLEAEHRGTETIALSELEKKPLSAENVVLRGCRLKNTEFIYGCAVYTGQDTKISLNSRYKPVKFSRVEKRMNAYLIAFLAILVLYSGIWTGLKYWWYSEPYDYHSEMAIWYIRPFEKDASFLNIISDFLAFMVLSNYVIPISMYVTIELMKFGGKLFFEWDVQMKDPYTSEYAKANTSDINEELGQVNFLFTDKTGTLTENEMKFRQCTINGVEYIDKDDTLCEKEKTASSTAAHHKPEVEHFLATIALCHTVRVEKSLSAGEYSETGEEYEYQSSSPDEKALVEACAQYGVIYHGFRDNKLEISYNNEMHYFKRHHVLDFDPTRKRMSCIIEDQNGNISLLTKGADSAMMPRCVSGDTKSTARHINSFAELGFRTLCIAERQLTKEEYLEYDIKLKEAKASLENREEMVAVVYDEIENSFTLLGATAVEDKLQDGVPETIVALRNAGIQVWVLTGDKVETAVNISHSAGHISSHMTELFLTHCHNATETSQKMQLFLSEVTLNNNLQYALVIDGQSLAYALSSSREPLKHLCMNVTTVLCCRMSPLQKAEVVRYMKTSESNPTTAAIGDGANDVSMIQEAHVGLGIMGKEGRQAVRCSDYAFGRFKFLQRCLLVHGHYFYWRIAILVQYFFYKNVAMITAQVYFTFFSAFSAVSVFEGFILTFFNITSTALPILLYGLFEIHVKDSKLLKYPALYMEISNNARLTSMEFIKWNMIGLWHSVVFFYGTYFAFAPDNSISIDGKNFGMYEFGSIIMTTCIISVNIKLMLHTYLWNGLTFFGFILTFLGYPSLIFLYTEALVPAFGITTALTGVFQNIWSSGYVWLLTLVLVVFSLLPDIILRYVADNFSALFVPRTQLSNDKVETVSEGCDNLSYQHKNDYIVAYEIGEYVKGSMDVVKTENNESTINTYL